MEISAIKGGAGVRRLMSNAILILNFHILFEYFPYIIEVNGIARPGVRPELGCVEKRLPGRLWTLPPQCLGGRAGL